MRHVFIVFFVVLVFSFANNFASRFFLAFDFVVAGFAQVLLFANALAFRMELGSLVDCCRAAVMEDLFTRPLADQQLVSLRYLFFADTTNWRVFIFCLILENTKS